MWTTGNLSKLENTKEFIKKTHNWQLQQSLHFKNLVKYQNQLVPNTELKQYILRHTAKMNICMWRCLKVDSKATPNENHWSIQFLVPRKEHAVPLPDLIHFLLRKWRLLPTLQFPASFFSFFLALFPQSSLPSHSSLWTGVSVRIWSVSVETEAKERKAEGFLDSLLSSVQRSDKRE